MRIPPTHPALTQASVKLRIAGDWGDWSPPLDKAPSFSPPNPSSHYSCDSTEKLKTLLPRLEQELKDTVKFKDFYQFTFTFAKNPGQKGLGEYKIQMCKKPQLKTK